MADLQQAQQQVEAQEEAVAIRIYKPNGEPYLAPDGETACTISVLGRESKRGREADRINTRRLLNAQRRKMEPEDVERNRVERAAALCVDFSGWEDNGQPVEFSKEYVRKLLAFGHILEQVEVGINAHADFSMPASST